MSAAQPPAQSRGMLTSFDTYKIAKTLRLAAGITGAGLSVLGFFSILTMIVSVNVPGLIISIYMIPFGLLIVLAELRWNWRFVMDAFPFLTTYLGRGVFYIFIGTLTLGIFYPWGYVAGAVLIANGIVSMIISCRPDAKEEAVTTAPPPGVAAAGTFANLFRGGQ
eukprot:tig00000342_g24200.t1